MSKGLLGCPRNYWDTQGITGMSGYTRVSIELLEYPRVYWNIN